MVLVWKLETPDKDWYPEKDRNIKNCVRMGNERREWEMREERDLKKEKKPNPTNNWFHIGEPKSGQGRRRVVGFISCAGSAWRVLLGTPGWEALLITWT